jgi:hypothetical protein
MSPQTINEFFAWAPLTLFVIILIVVYYAKRNEGAAPVAQGKTYSCAQCGRRGKHEHMVPISREGAVVWYCDRCAQSAQSAQSSR